MSLVQTEFHAKPRCAFIEKFDYTPWQRQERCKSIQDVTKSKQTKIKPVLSTATLKNPYLTKRPISTGSHYSETPAQEVPTSFPVFGRECSTLCRHGKKEPPIEVVKLEKRISKDGIITLLKFQVKETKNSLKLCKARYLNLIRENIKLKEALCIYEAESHLDDKMLVDKYNKFDTALDVITREHDRQYINDTNEYEHIRCKVENVTTALKKDAKVLDDKIKESEKSLKILINYKEKEYPEKLEQIKNLKDELLHLTLLYEDRLKALNDMVTIETDEYTNKYGANVDNVKSHIADMALSFMSPDVKTMVQQNSTMRKEIELHKEELFQSTNSVEQLQHEIKQLQIDSHMKMKKLKHPQGYMTKCLPDSEYSLNIPQQKWLPI